jgi:GTP-binding protein
MKFIDEATILVHAGKGGDGCCSFRREKFIPFGGPNGGDGGQGGSIYLRATSRLNTLIDLNYKKIYQAENGKPGKGNLCSGRSGQELIINVPIGTMVWEDDTNEIIGDLVAEDQLVVVAQGGKGGLGNHHFKSSTNRTPRKIIKGQLGEKRNLKLELKLLADVGLLGFPNAGKSTLINKVSAARPKIANYPFTTLEPKLGVVKVGQNSFVMADVPGLLEGASQGVGLGFKFLRHLSRNKLLLHMVDLSNSLMVESTQPDNNGIDENSIIDNLIKQIKIIESELKNYRDQKLHNIQRWIIINKVDLLMPKQLNSLINRFSTKYKNTVTNNRVFFISAVSGYGIDELCKNIIEYLGDNYGKYR